MTIDIRILPGLTPYAEGLDLQKKLVDERARNTIVDTVLLLEHPPVITLGRSAAPEGVLASPEFLAARGIDVFRIERGGQATWHCPGQLVGYYIVNLHARGLGISAFVWNIEEVMRRAAIFLGVDAMRIPGKTGIFHTGPRPAKIGALGVRISRGISFHGMALNIHPDLSGYRLIVPCGMADTPVSSIAVERGTSPSMDEARTAVIDAVKEVFDQNVSVSGSLTSSR